MNNKIKYLGKNVFLFMLNGFVPRLISFFMVPIYTGYLTTAEYGVSDLIMTTVWLCVPIFTLDIQDAVMRFALDKNYDQKDVFSVAFRINLIGAVCVCVGAFIVSLLHISGVEKNYLIFFVVIYFMTALSNSISLFCRGIDKVHVMVESGVLSSIAGVLLNILFLVCFKWGLMGYLFANTIGSVLGLLWCVFRAKLYRYIKFRIPGDLHREMIKFSFPLIFSVIAWWINSSSDRYILTGMLGIAASGLYAVAYKIPNILTVFQNVFTQAWSISAIKEFDKNDSDGFISNMYTMMNLGMVILCSGIMVFNIPLAKILYSNDFYEAWKFVPPLLISVVFNAMALFIGSIFTAVKDTKTLSASTIIGAVVNIVCNVIFIKLCGSYGAALATLLGYAVVMIMRHVILRKHVILHINWFRDITVYFVLIIQMVISMWGINAILWQLIPFMIIMISYGKEINLFLKRIRRKGK